MRNFTNTQKAFDEIAKIVCEEKQKEIEELRKYIEDLGHEGRELCAKYTTMTNLDSEIDLFGDAHDLFDFLQAI